MRKTLALPAALLALTAVAVPAASAAPARAAGPPTVILTTTAGGKSYDTTKLTAPAGRQFLLAFRNTTRQQHNVSLEQGELEYGATLTIRKGSTSSIFILRKGVYHFYSSIGNDENAGMSGTLVVK
jgi:plastocyanin